jgi:hypothetical protein
MNLSKSGVFRLSVIGLVLTASAAAITTVGQTAQASTQSKAYSPSCPAMKSALANLQAAQTQLSRADSNYQGHRVAALNATKTAINQVKQGLNSRDCKR